MCSECKRDHGILLEKHDKRKERSKTKNNISSFRVNACSGRMKLLQGATASTRLSEVTFLFAAAREVPEWFF